MVELLYDETDMDLMEILLSDVTRLYNRWVFLKECRSLCPVPTSFTPWILDYFDHHVKIQKHQSLSGLIDSLGLGMES